MNSAKNIEKLLRKINVAPSARMDQRALESILLAQEKSKKTSSADIPPNIWRIIMKSRITKLAIAAALLIAVGIGLIHRQGNREIQIPPELAKMPVEKLLDIHNDLAESPYQSSLVEAALKSSLDKIPARQVLALAGKNGKSVKSQELLPYVAKPVTEMVEAADIIIYGRVNEVVLDVSDLKDAILRKQQDLIKERFSARIKAEVELEVFGGYPAAPVAKGEKLILWPIINTRKLDAIKEGHEYLILLKQRGETIWMLPYQEGVYPVDADTAMVSGLRSGQMPLDDMWDFMVGSYQVIHEGNEPSQEALDYWTDKLKTGDLADNWTAVEYFSTLAEPPIDAQMLAEAVAAQFKMRIQKTRENGLQIQKEQYQRTTFVKEAVTLLSRLGDATACARMLDMYEENADLLRELQPLILRMVMTLSMEDDQEILKQYLSQVDKGQLSETLQSFIRTPGKDVEQILLYIMEDPAGYGVPHTDTLQLVWHGLAKRANPEFRAYMEEFLADPENTDLGVKHYKDDINQTIRSARRTLNKYWSSNEPQKDGSQIIRDSIERYRQGKDSIWSLTRPGTPNSSRYFFIPPVLDESRMIFPRASSLLNSSRFALPSKISSVSIPSFGVGQLQPISEVGLS